MNPEDEGRWLHGASLYHSLFIFSSSVLGDNEDENKYGDIPVAEVIVYLPFF